jgi:hypothetical protein
MCVQRFDDSLNSAIHITYRISLRSSSMREPRDPLLKVVLNRLLKSLFSCSVKFHKVGIMIFGAGPLAWNHIQAPKLQYGQSQHKGKDLSVLKDYLLVMILPQVHLRKPCYDFYFL